MAPVAWDTPAAARLIGAPTFGPSPARGNPLFDASGVVLAAHAGQTLEATLVAASQQQQQQEGAPSSQTFVASLAAALVRVMSAAGRVGVGLLSLTPLYVFVADPAAAAAPDNDNDDNGTLPHAFIATRLAHAVRADKVVRLDRQLPEFGAVATAADARLLAGAADPVALAAAAVAHDALAAAADAPHDALGLDCAAARLAKARVVPLHYDACCVALTLYAAALPHRVYGGCSPDDVCDRAVGALVGWARGLCAGEAVALETVAELQAANGWSLPAAEAFVVLLASLIGASFGEAAYLLAHPFFEHALGAFLGHAELGAPAGEDVGLAAEAAARAAQGRAEAAWAARVAAAAASAEPDAVAVDLQQAIAWEQLPRVAGLGQGGFGAAYKVIAPIAVPSAADAAGAAALAPRATPYAIKVALPQRDLMATAGGWLVEVGALDRAARARFVNGRPAASEMVTAGAATFARAGPRGGRLPWQVMLSGPAAVEAHCPTELFSVLRLYEGGDANGHLGVLNEQAEEAFQAVVRARRDEAAARRMAEAACAAAFSTAAFARQRVNGGGGGGGTGRHAVALVAAAEAFADRADARLARASERVVLTEAAVRAFGRVRVRFGLSALYAALSSMAALHAGGMASLDVKPGNFLFERTFLADETAYEDAEGTRAVIRALDDDSAAAAAASEEPEEEQEEEEEEGERGEGGGEVGGGALSDGALGNGGSAASSVYQSAGGALSDGGATVYQSAGGAPPPNANADADADADADGPPAPAPAPAPLRPPICARPVVPCVVADLGMSLVLHPSDPSRGDEAWLDAEPYGGLLGGTPQYVAPEVNAAIAAHGGHVPASCDGEATAAALAAANDLRAAGVGAPADVWALGVMALEWIAPCDGFALDLKHPHNMQRPSAGGRQGEAGDLADLLLPLHARNALEARGLIGPCAAAAGPFAGLVRAMLARNPDARPTAAQALQHPLFTSPGAEEALIEFFGFAEGAGGVGILTGRAAVASGTGDSVEWLRAVGVVQPQPCVKEEEAEQQEEEAAAMVVVAAAQRGGDGDGAGAGDFGGAWGEPLGSASAPAAPAEPVVAAAAFNPPPGFAHVLAAPAEQVAEVRAEAWIGAIAADGGAACCWADLIAAARGQGAAVAADAGAEAPALASEPAPVAPQIYPANDGGGGDDDDDKAYALAVAIGACLSPPRSLLAAAPQKQWGPTSLPSHLGSECGGGGDGDDGDDGDDEGAASSASSSSSGALALALAAAEALLLQAPESGADVAAPQEDEGGVHCGGTAASALESSALALPSPPPRDAGRARARPRGPAARPLLLERAAAGAAAAAAAAAMGAPHGGLLAGDSLPGTPARVAEADRLLPQSGSAAPSTASAGSSSAVGVVAVPAVVAAAPAPAASGGGDDRDDDSCDDGLAAAAADDLAAAFAALTIHCNGGDACSAPSPERLSARLAAVVMGPSAAAAIVPPADPSGAEAPTDGDGDDDGDDDDDHDGDDDDDDDDGAPFPEDLALGAWIASSLMTDVRPADALPSSPAPEPPCASSSSSSSSPAAAQADANDASPTCSLPSALPPAPSSSSSSSSSFPLSACAACAGLGHALRSAVWLGCAVRHRGLRPVVQDLLMQLVPTAV